MAENVAERLVRRILRVDHAGEHGAIAIYRAQIAGLGERHPQLRRWLGETLSHEERHRLRFRQAMPERGAKPCRTLTVWTVGGATLGRLTAAMGAEAVLACTAAVERTVHLHLLDQARFLDGVDPALADLVRDIQSEEDQHLAFALAHHDHRKLIPKTISAVVTIATEALIAISTRGDSYRLPRALADFI